MNKTAIIIFMLLNLVTNVQAEEMITKEFLEQQVQETYDNFSLVVNEFNSPDEKIPNLAFISQDLFKNYSKYRDEMRSKEFLSSNNDLKYITITSHTINLQRRLITNLLQSFSISHNTDQPEFDKVEAAWTTWTAQESLYTNYVKEGHFLE